MARTPDYSASLIFQMTCRATLVILILLCAATVMAQQQQVPARRKPPQRTLAKTASSATQEPKFKGIWEPVNYNQDLQLTDVYFVTADIGYVSGAKGTILKSTDGGRTWTPQLGGDPQSQEADIGALRFIDQTHGWALQGNAYDPKKLLRTSDGQNWEQVGALPQGWGLLDYQFLSPTEGLLLDGNTNVSHILRTTDGGRTWAEVFPVSACRAKLEIQGLTQDVQCVLSAMHFSSVTVGYAVGFTGADLTTLFLAKTEDGGASWSLSFLRDFGQIGGSAYDYLAVFFKDESSGIVNLGHYQSSQPFATTDGGRTWHGLPTSLPGVMKFADPEVGWVFDHFNFGVDYTLRYTTDGGTRWASRTFRFPAEVLGFSLPRRDRGYVAGNHGMIYRYRVVPVTYQAAAHSIDAPAMPSIDSPVANEVATLRDTLAKLQTKLPAPAGGTTGAGAAGGFQQDTGSALAGGGYVDSCCGPLMQQLETTADAFATDVPSFAQRFRNMNLILSGLQFLSSVTSQAQLLKQQIRALRQARDPQAASAALAQVSSQVNGISTSGGFVQDTTLPQPQP